MTGTAIFEKLIDYLLEVNQVDGLILERAGDEFFAHVEWTPKPNSTSNGNASGYGLTPGEAILNMLESIHPSTLPAEIVEGEQYQASVNWGNGETKPGSHAAQQRDYYKNYPTDMTPRTGK